MTMEKLITVIIPAYNCADTIEAAIESVLNQEVPVEILVLNDQSPDHLDAVMEKYKENESVHYIHNEKNLGAAGSRNKGASMAETPYVAFLDADDIWAGGKLKKQLERIKETGVVLCSTGRQLMRPDGTCTEKYIPVKARITYKELLRHNSINCSSVLLKTEVAREFPMEHEDSHEDYITWLKILKKYGIAAGIDEPLLLYRLTTTGKSGNKLKSASMNWKVYRYMGFGYIRSCFYFCSYAIHGIIKYL